MMKLQPLTGLPLVWGLFLFHVWSMLFGVFMVEWGYGTGYFASKAYIQYAFTLTLAAFFAAVFFFPYLEQKMKAESATEDSFSSLKVGFALQILILLVLVLAFDGLAVILGEKFRGEYRIQFGNFGFLLAVLSKYCAPVLLTFVTFDLFHRRRARTRQDLVLFGLLFALTFFIGLMMGGKTTALRAVMGSVILLIARRLSLRQGAILAGFLALSLMAGAFIFDRKSGFSEAASYIAARMTTIQGRAPWDVYRKHSQGETLPDYPPTLLSALGSPVVTWLTGAKRPSLEYARYDYGMTMTAFVESPRPDVLSGEYNLTGGIISEAIIAFRHNTLGYHLFILFAGLFSGLNMALIYAAFRKQKPVLLSISLVYFVYVTLSWINTGGVTILFHIVTVLGLASMWILLSALQRISNSRFFRSK